ncbi:MAG: hypothetical protein FWC41_09155 [Firmicutes bacterium]|nr:hypothetical protein [Bacillota bacterium]
MKKLNRKIGDFTFKFRGIIFYQFAVITKKIICKLGKKRQSTDARTLTAIMELEAYKIYKEQENKSYLDDDN